MKSISLETLRLNLSKEIDALNEPILILKRGKVVGYLVSNLQDTSLTGKAETLEKQPCQPMPEPDNVHPGASGSVNKSVTAPDIAINTIYKPDPVKPVKQAKQLIGKQVHPVVSAMLSGISKRVVAHHPQCKCPLCKP